MKRVVIKGFVAILDECEDRNIGFFNKKQSNDKYNYGNKPIAEICDVLMDFLGKRVKVTIGEEDKKKM